MDQDTGGGMIPKSPCVNCDRQESNKEDFWTQDSCATFCPELLLYQKAVRLVEQGVPAADPGQCLVCRRPAEGYCDHCRKVATRNMRDKQAGKNAYKHVNNRSRRPCRICGHHRGDYGGLCQKCYNADRHAQAKAGKIKIALPKKEIHKKYQQIEPQVYRMTHVCEYCGGIIYDSVHYRRRSVAGMRLYAHGECIAEHAKRQPSESEMAISMEVA